MHLPSATPPGPRGMSDRLLKPIPLPAMDGRAGAIHRRFFTGAIATVLTLGASWGVLLLINIALKRSFISNSIHAVNAHGHAQIFGWVGLFIMGFGYEVFPRIWRVELRGARLAGPAFVLMCLGLLSVSTALVIGSMPLAMAGAAGEAVAAGCFVAQMLASLRRSDAPLDPSMGFLIGGMTALPAMVLFGAFHKYVTMTAPTREQLLWYVATYQAPLRDLQIHGVAMLMIVGVSLRILPEWFGAPAVPARRAWTALALLAGGVTGEIAIFIAYRWSGNHLIAALLLVPWLMLLSGSILVAWGWRLWRPLPVADRSGKFIRAAYGWLIGSLVMLLLLPVYQALCGIAFSHAYYGAIRHAITVGFISLMIMGVAAKVVPALNGVDRRQLPSLAGPFLLINLGCFLRVALQSLTDFLPWTYDLIGISGVLELSALAWWGFGLIRIMLGRQRALLAAPEGGAISV